MDNLISGFSIFGLLLAILFSCLCFANAIEHLGEYLKLGKQVTGSILAAVGTALPETIVPLVAIYVAAKQAAGALHTEKTLSRFGETGLSTEAIVSGHTACEPGLGSCAEQIAVGAIIGAPFMLSTLAFLVLAITIFIFRKKRGTTDLLINRKHLRRDLYFFLGSFVLLVIASDLSQVFKNIIAIFLLVKYAFYVYLTVRAGQEEDEVEEPDLPKLYLKLFKLPENLFTISAQAIIGLIGIIYFAEIFVHTLEHLAVTWNISPIVLSLIITPIATELPEKVNSSIWASEKKDTLAMGNLTGAMVFQTAIPGTIGLLMTPWKFDTLAYSCAIIAIISTLILIVELNFFKKLSAKTLLFAGLLYLVYIGIIFLR